MTHKSLWICTKAIKENIEANNNNNEYYYLFAHLDFSLKKRNRNNIIDLYNSSDSRGDLCVCCGTV